MIFFTADTHFGHGNVIQLCDRPLSSVEEMDEANLRRCDKICLRICAAALVLISFLCAVGRFALTTEIIVYCLVGVLVFLAVIRTILFYFMDKKGL